MPDVATRWLEHVDLLSSDEMRGRQTGSPEYQRAAQYVAAELRKLGLEPGAGGKLQLVAAEWFSPLTPELKGRPELFGRPFDGPMEGHHPLMPHGLHHYDLHVWLWKDNPAGMFSPTNPKIKCPKGPYTFEETAPKIVPHK